MDENDDAKPLLWLIDSGRAPLAASLGVFEDWADVRYFASEPAESEWERPPDAVFFSAEFAGGAEGEAFGRLVAAAGAVPLLAVARLRSFTQAVAFFRAGADDYLSLPLEEEDVWERFNAAIERMARLAMRGLLVELEPSEAAPDSVDMSLRSAVSAVEPSGDASPEAEEDILARLSADLAGESGLNATEPQDGAEEEPIAVDGLPIPNLWEELPCGLLVFDSNGNLVFSNTLALVLFGCPSLAELQDMLENNRAAFAAHGANHKPLPDNQWPQTQAARTRTARSAVISIERSDRRRLWLRIDCMPHLADGAISRLSMTLVNLTGELAPLQTASAAPAKREKAKRSKRRK